MRPVGDDELELYNLDEDAPQVAGIVDERPEELRTMEEFRTSKRWKVVSDSTSDIIITELNASPGSNNHENNVTKKRSSVRGRRGSEGAESEDSSLQHSIRDSKKHREDSDASPPRKSRAPSSSKSCLEKAPALQIKSERITDSDSDISVSRKSDFRHRNEREPEVSKKHYVKQELPDSHKGAHDNSKKKPLQNYSDRRHHMFQGEDTKTKNPSSKERWKNDAKSDSYTHGKDFPKQNQYHRSETLSERNHNEFHRGMLLKDGKTFSNPKNESDEDSDSDLPLPRKSRKTERGKHSSYEQKKENRKKELDKGSDSDLSLSRPSMLTDKEKNKKREKVKKKHRKKDTSEQSDYDLSPPQHSGSRYREKQKRPEEVKKIHRRKGSSKESDSDLSLPRPSKSKEKHKRPEVKKGYRKKGSSEESVSDLSPLLPSKSNEKCRRQEVKKSNRKKGSSEDSDSDLSVPRQSNSTGREKLTMQEVKKRHRKRGLSEHSDSDFSPPRHAEIRGREKQKKSEVKKRRRKKGSSEESDSDLSLPRPSKSKEKHKRLEDVKKRHRKKGSSEESVSDSSPSQISKSRDRLKYNNVEEVHKKYNRKESSGKGSDSNSSPQPSKNKGGNKHGIADERANVNDRSNLDIRISQSRQKDIEKSYQRKAQSAYSKKKLNNSDSSGPQTPERSNRYDHSPVGGKRSNSRACSPEERHARKHDSHSISSRREARHRSNSPPRRQPHSDHKSDRNSSVRNSRSPEAGNRKLQKTLDGKRAGLQDAKLLREELKSFAERENNMFSKMSDDVSGRLAEAVQRDRKTGKKRDLDEEARQQKEKEEKDRKFKEKYSRWGKGLKQVEEQKRNVEEAMKLMAKPLARYADDEDLDKHLRDQEREGDPMLEYIRSKKSGSSDSKTTAKLKYQGSYPTNRFSIPPGYRWDGVDRSNGYEKQWFEQRSAQKAREEEAYKWSSADM